MDSDAELRRGVGEKPLVVPQPPQGGASDGVPSDTTEDDWSRGSGEDPDLEIEHNTTPVQRSITDLDRKVCDLSNGNSHFQHYTCIVKSTCN